MSDYLYVDTFSYVWCGVGGGGKGVGVICGGQPKGIGPVHSARTKVGFHNRTVVCVPRREHNGPRPSRLALSNIRWNFACEIKSVNIISLKRIFITNSNIMDLRQHGVLNEQIREKQNN